MPLNMIFVGAFQSRQFLGELFGTITNKEVARRCISNSIRLKTKTTSVSKTSHLQDLTLINWKHIVASPLDHSCLAWNGVGETNSWMSQVFLLCHFFLVHSSSRTRHWPGDAATGELWSLISYFWLFYLQHIFFQEYKKQYLKGYVFATNFADVH